MVEFLKGIACQKKCQYCGVVDPDLELGLFNQATPPAQTTTLDHDPAQTRTDDLNRLRFISDTFEVFSRYLRDSI